MSEIKHPQELALLNKYLSGERDAGEKLFGAAYPKVRNYVFSQTKNSVISARDKEDIIEESMLRALQKLHFFNGSSKFEVFVIGYAKNIILEQLRKKARELKKVVLVDDFSSLDNLDLFDDPLSIVIEKEQLEAVYNAFSLLEKEQQDILKLRLINGMPFKQLAQIMGKSDDAVDSAFRRALRAFKNNFEKTYKNMTDF